MTDQQLIYLNRVIEQIKKTQIELEDLRISVTENKNVGPPLVNYFMLIRLNLRNEFKDRFHLISNNKEITISPIQFSRLAILAVVKKYFSPGASIPRQILLSESNDENKHYENKNKKRTDTFINSLNESICNVFNIGCSPYLPVEKVDTARIRLSYLYHIDISLVLSDNITISGLKSTTIMHNILNNFIAEKKYVRKNGSDLTFESLIVDEIEKEEWIHSCLLANELNKIFKNDVNLPQVIQENNHD